MSISHPHSTPRQYNEAADFTLSSKKRKRSKSEGDPAPTTGDEEAATTPSGKKRKRAESEAVGEREEGGEEEKTPVSKKHKKKVSFSFGEGEVGVTPPSTKKQKKKVKKEREQQQEEEEGLETPVKTEPEEMEVWSNGTKFCYYDVRARSDLYFLVQ